jgi:acyl-CoA thioesterase-1
MEVESGGVAALASCASMDSDLRVCFLGDSFVAGTGDPEHLGWVGRLTTRTHQAGRPLTAYNLGVRRQTSSEIRDRWWAECSARLPAGCDARLIVSFGVNDTTIEYGRQHVDTINSCTHLTEMLQGARATGWPVLVVGPPPVSDPAHNDRTLHLDEQLHAVASRLDVPYVSILASLTESSVWMGQVEAGDGAHPSGEGYAVLADLLWPAWTDWLATSAPT